MSFLTCFLPAMVIHNMMNNKKGSANFDPAFIMDIISNSLFYFSSWPKVDKIPSIIPFTCFLNVLSPRIAFTMVGLH